MKKRKLLIATTVLFVTCHTASAASYTSLIRRGNRFYSNELYNEALRYYLESKEIEDKAHEPVFNSGASYYKMEAFYKALESFSNSIQFIKNDKKKADVYYNLGNSYFRLGDYPKAAESYMKSLEIDPVDLNTKYNLELTLEKLQESEQEGDEENEPQSGPEGMENQTQKDGEEKEKQEKSDTENEQNENNIEQKKESDSEDPSKKDFTQEEAERLINALNTDQTDIMNDIIINRVGRIQNEKDW
jgi:tetratricopeptide (TPR) repeat protein